MSPDFKPGFKRITYTSLLAKGIMKELESLDTQQAILYVNSDIEPCDVGLYGYSITTSKIGSSKLFQYLLIGQTQSGRILSDSECRDLLNLSVTNIDDGEAKPFQLQKTNLFEDFEEAGNLDDKVIKEDIIKDYLKKKEGSIAYEVEKLKLMAGREKTQLQANLNELRDEVKELKKQLLDKMTDRLEELKVTKRLKLIEKELREKEEKLFFAEAKVDVDTEKNIEELTNSYNFDVLKTCKFKLRLLPTQNS